MTNRNLTLPTSARHGLSIRDTAAFAVWFDERVRAHSELLLQPQATRWLFAECLDNASDSWTDNALDCAKATAMSYFEDPVGMSLPGYVAPKQRLEIRVTVEVMTEDGDVIVDYVCLEDVEDGQPAAGFLGDIAHTVDVACCEADEEVNG